MNRLRECCFKTAPSEGRRLIWEITHTCHFACDYCFQSKKRLKNIIRIIDKSDLLAICEKIKKMGVKDVLLTGGEIFHVREQIGPVCNYFKKNNITYSFSTAQLSKKDFISYLYSLKPKSINISFDPKGYKQTESQYEIFTKNIEYILSLSELNDEVDIKITGVINESNQENIYTYLNTVNDYANSNKFLSSVYITNPYDIGFIKTNIRPKEDKLREIVRHVNSGDYSDKIKLVNFPRQNAPLQHCMAGEHYFHLEPNGNVYPCHLFANYSQDVFLMGNILFDTPDELDQKLKIFANQSTKAVVKYKNEIKECIECVERDSCGGGCLAEVISIGQLIEPMFICKYLKYPKQTELYTPKQQTTLLFNDKKDLTYEEEQKIIDKIKVNLHKQDHDLSHGFDHTECVVSLARYIAQREGANLRIVTAAAYFHDYAPRQELLYESHTRVSANEAVKFLKIIGFSDEERNEVYLCIDSSSYGSSQLGIAPISLEAKIVRDADWLEAIGARGIARVFAFGATHGCETLGKVNWDIDNPPQKRMSLIGPDPSPIYHFFSKLLWIKDKIQTKTGKEIAKVRHQRMIEFLKDYSSEMPSHCEKSDK